VSKSSWKKRVWDYCGGICVVCGYPATRGNPLTIHHKKARCRKGNNSIENCVLWHRTFHQDYHKKHGNKTSDSFGSPI
jgi:hypothetical protein